MDEEIEDSRHASELPETEGLNADEGEGDDNDVEDGAPRTTDDATVAALKSIDALDPTAEQKQLNAQEAAEAKNDGGSGAGSENAAPEADPDVLPLGDEILMPTPADQIMPEPAEDGPDLAEIAQEQLMTDAVAFATAPSGMIPVDDDGVISDSAMDFAIGEP